jgi:hypothetical protein
MAHHATWEYIVLLLTALSACALLWRLVSQGLVRQYRFLAAFLAVALVQALIFLPLAPASTAYAWAYFITSPVLWILYFFVVLELYRLILEDYPGISSAVGKGVTWSMALAVVLALLSALPGLNTGSRQFPALRMFLAVERSVALGLLLFLVLMQAFLFRYRLRLPRNRLIYATGYALYFGITVSSDIILAELLGGQVFVPVSLGVGIAGALILFTGSVLLTREGEARVDPLDTYDTSPERARLQQQLVEMNRMLTKVARGG